MGKLGKRRVRLAASNRLPEVELQSHSLRRGCSAHFKAKPKHCTNNRGFQGYLFLSHQTFFGYSKLNPLKANCGVLLCKWLKQTRVVARSSPPGGEPGSGKQGRSATHTETSGEIRHSVNTNGSCDTKYEDSQPAKRRKQCSAPAVTEPLHLRRSYRLAFPQQLASKSLCQSSTSASY
jgi:hypothetical protein